MGVWKKRMTSLLVATTLILSQTGMVVYGEDGQQKTEKEISEILSETDQKESGTEKVDQEEVDQEETDKEEVDQKEADKGETDKEEADQKEADKGETDKEEVDQKEADKGETDKEEVDQEEVDKEETDKEEVDKEEADQEEVDKEETDKEEVDQEKIDEEIAEEENEIIIEEIVEETDLLEEKDLAKLSLVEQAALRAEKAKKNGKMARNTRLAGDQSDPFIIGSAETLAELAELTNGNAAYSNGAGGELKFSAANYKLAADIDLSGITNWTPIGTNDNPFTGTFDGENYIILNLTINEPDMDYVGLFGYIEGGTIQNVGLEGGSVIGRDYVSGLVGKKYYGEISNSYAAGTVAGNDYVGGIVGEQYNGEISNSYAAVVVTGNDYVGGIVGEQYNGKISNSYAAGTVAGNNLVGGFLGNQRKGEISNSYAAVAVTGKYHVGGIVGMLEEGKISNSYVTGDVEGGLRVGGLVGQIPYSGKINNCIALNKKVSGQASVGKVIGNNNADYVNNCYSFYGMKGGSFSGGTNGTDVSYDEQNGFSVDWSSIFDNLSAWENVDGQHLPTLKDVKGPQNSAVPDYIKNNGSTVTDPLVISTAAELEEFRDTVNGLNGKTPDDFRGRTVQLSDHIDLGDIANWIPIGTEDNPFKGTFDGQNHVVENLTIYQPNMEYVGLFGYVGGNGAIQNVGVEDVTVTGYRYVGGLVGKAGESSAPASISNSYATGSVTSEQRYAGGLVGFIMGEITSCYAAVNVKGDEYIGGLVGSNTEKISNSYAAGNVEGREFVGGLAGESQGDIVNSYATGGVKGEKYIGGLVGFTQKSIRNSAALNEFVNATNSDAGKIVGFIMNHAVVENCYSWENMTVTGSGDTASTGHSDDGAVLRYSLEKGFMKEDGTKLDWKSGIFTDDADSAWIISGGKLPILKEAGGSQNDVVPAYITKADLVIKTEEDLIAFRDTVNSGTDKFEGKTVLLAADITLTDAWTPIGTLDQPFKGTFDGGGYAIKGLKIDASDENGKFGLFGVVSGNTTRNATIRNLSVEDIDIDIDIVGYFSMVGGVAGVLYDATVENCFTTGSITVSSRSAEVGGIVGRAGQGLITGTITNCYSTVTVTAENSIAGGIAGALYNGTVEDCAALNDDVAGRIAGKIVGDGTAGSNCFALDTLWLKTSNPNNDGAGTAKEVTEIAKDTTLFPDGVWIKEEAFYPRLEHSEKVQIKSLTEQAAYNLTVTVMLDGEVITGDNELSKKQLRLMNKFVQYGKIEPIKDGKVVFENVPYDIYDLQYGGEMVQESFTIDKNLNITINFYTVSFQSENGEDLGIEEQVLLSGEKAAKPAAEPTKEGAVFGYWQKKGDTSGKFDFDTTIDSETKLEPAWLCFSADDIMFDPLVEGYTKDDITEKTITVTNTGDVALDLKLTQGSNYFILDKDTATVEAGKSVEFKVKPVVGLSSGVIYTGTVQVNGSYQDGTVQKSVSKDITLKLEVKNANLAIQVTPETVSLKDIKEGYTQVQKETVQVENKGNVTVSLTLDTQGKGDFSVSGFTVNGVTGETVSLKAGEKATVTVEPNKGLSSGDYQGTIKVIGSYGKDTVEKDVSLALKVKEADNLDIAVGQQEFTFDTVKEGYAQPKAQTVTVKNIGDVEAKLELKIESDAFLVGALDKDTLAVGDTATFTIQPKEGLTEGTYTGTVTVIANGTVEQVVSIEFTVKKKKTGGGSGGSSSSGNIIDSTVKENETEEEKESETEITPITPPATEGEEEIYFEDVEKIDWFYDAVQYVTKNGLMRGTGENSFSPNMPLTREMLAVILYNMEQKPSVAGMEIAFQDVKAGQWYTNAIIWAKNNGVVAGYSEDFFGIGDRITREQLVTILYRYTKIKGIDTAVNGNGLEKFADKDTVSDYAVDGVTWAIDVGILSGDGINLYPQRNATRAEVASIWMRYCEDIAAKQ